MEAARVLVVDDDPDIREMLESTLGYAGFAVTSVDSATAAVAAITASRPDALVVDVQMPRLDGFGLVHLLRDAGDRIPVLFLSARDAVEDRVRGLRIGGDDYLTKPFDVVEVAARIEALLRRAGDGAADEADVLTAGGITLDVERHELLVDGAPIELSPTEFRLLELLLRNADRVISKEQILARLWGYDFGGDTNVVERFVANLRRKLGADASSAVVTVRGFGYRITTQR